MDKNDAQFIGSIPDYYDRGLGPVLFSDFAADMAGRAAELAPKRVLETAAGTGIVSRALRDRLPADARLTVTDLNPPMLEIARRKFTADELVEVQMADAQALPFADAAFDAMVCQFGVMFYPDKPKSYREALRVLRPGGTYLFSVWDAHRHNGFARITDGLIRQFFPVDPPGFYRVPFSCSEIDPIKEALLEAGFAGLSIDVLRIDKQVSELKPFAEGLILGNPLVDQIRARGGVAPEELVAAVVEALGREFGTSPASIPLHTITYAARRAA